MIEHETHFIRNLMDEGLSVLAMRTLDWLVVYLNVRGGSGSEHLGGKSSREFKNRCGEVGGVENMSGRVWLFEGSRIGDDSFEERSMMFGWEVLHGGFLVKEEALVAIFGGEQGKVLA
ncbi:hypothetical protein Tco_0983982 [Tanacetum coccineum]